MTRPLLQIITFIGQTERCELADLFVYFSCVRLIIQPTVILTKYGSMEYMHVHMYYACMYLCCTYV